MTIVAMKIEKEKGNYWNGTGRFEDLGKWLDKLVPAAGACAAHHGRLEKYRLMCNAYYDLFNNGGGTTSTLASLTIFQNASLLPREISPSGI